MFTKWNFFLPAVVFMVLLSSVFTFTNDTNNVYLEYKLEQICDDQGGNILVPLGRQPAKLTLDQPSNQPLRCYLTLQAPKGFGFYVFMDVLKITDANVDQCRNNFLQFGRYIDWFAQYMKRHAFYGIWHLSILLRL